jgi:hypothetical protein
MKRRKRQRIEKALQKIEEHLANAEAYLARNVNVEGNSFLHLDDWQGRSGHPLWTRNKMIPTLVQDRGGKERALDAIDKKAKDKQRRARRQAAVPPKE